MTDLRPLLERMANELDYFCQLLRDDRREIHALAAEARAALAQPAADGEVAELVAALDQLASAAEMYGPAGGADGRALNDAVAFARAVLERWGSAAPQPVVKRLPDGSQVIEPQDRVLLAPQPQPVPVSERLPDLFQRLDQIVDGIDRDESHDSGGWWQTSDGAKFGKIKLRELRQLIADAIAAHAIPLPSEEKS